MRIILLIVLIKLALCMPPLPSLEKTCGVCDTNNCGEKPNCRHGYVKDTCNCCDVCLRKEGEHCGGLDSISGVCDTGLFCNVRRPFSKRNDHLPTELKTGRCEPDACKDTLCGKHQYCSVEDGKPLCLCRKDCSEEDAPVCGLHNHKQYKNLCSLRREECETQSKIHYMPGECLGCTDENGTLHDQNTVLKSENICELKRCSHGKWKKFIDPDCLQKSGYSCSTGSRKHPPMQCQKGYFCKITKKSETKGYVDFGECTKLDMNRCFFDDREFKLNETFVNKACNGFCRCTGMNGISCVSLCPPRNAICRHDQTLVEEREEVSKDPRCSCVVKRCIDNADVCKREKYAGPCMAYFERWYYNSQSNQCEKFVFGGCRSNGNNFRSKKECERRCTTNEEEVLIPPLVIEDTVSSVSRSKKDSFPISVPDKPELSSQMMTIRGQIAFDKFQNISSPSCLVVAFTETSKMDVSSVVMETATFKFTEYDTSEPYFYKMNTMKPAEKELQRMFTVRACLHVGWCPSKLSSIKAGDYVTTTSHPVKLEKDIDMYERDLQLKCFDCEKEVAEEIKPPVVANDDVPVPDIPDLPEPEFEFPGDAQNPGPEFSDKMITLKGQIKLPHNVGVLPDKSCLTITFQDISLQDASSFPISSVEVNLSKSNKGRRFNYFLEARKPADRYLGMSYSLSATINYGWCRTQSKNEWVRRGDYLTDTVHRVLLEKDVDEYVQDINLICYACPSDRGIEDPVEDIVKKLIRPDEQMKVSDVIVTDEFDNPEDEPRMSDKNITIGGYLLFPKDVGKLPSPSCLSISFADITLQDVEAMTLSSINIDVSDLTIDKKFLYVIESSKPIDDDLSRSYDISATLNVGWCNSNRTESLRYGDYYVDTIHPVMLERNVSVYEKDITMVLSEMMEVDDTDIVGDDDASIVPDITWPPKLGNTFMEVSGFLNFKEAPGKIPTGSCLKLAFQETTRADGPAFNIKEKTIDVSEETIGLKFKYALGFNKPEKSEWSRTYEINAVLNMGWCPTAEDNDWIREGDYQTVLSFVVNLTQEDLYTLDLIMNKFCTTPACTTQLPPPSEQVQTSCFDDITNKTYGHDEMWKRSACETCQCDKGKIECSVVDCPVLDCDGEIVYVEGKCCAICKRGVPRKCFDSVLNETFENGDSWKQDDCTTCTCDEGKRICASQGCAPMLCANPVKKPGKCCPECPERDFEKCQERTTNITHKEGDSWTEDNGCMKCFCIGGQSYCASTTCGLPDCPDGQLKNVKGICCPVCSTHKICTDPITEKLHTEGNIWQNDSCSLCKCTSDGTVCDEPNEDIEGCSNVVQLNKSCKRLCLDKPTIDP